MKIDSRIFIFLFFIPIAFFADPYVQSQFIFIKQNLQNYLFMYLIDNSMDIIGNGGYQALFCLFLLILGKYLKKKNLFYSGKYGLIGLVTSGAIVQTLKHLIGRARPGFNEAYLFLGPNLKDGFDSFPSGHTIGAFTIAVVFSNVYPRIGFLLYGIASFIGLWRLYDNSHFLSDVFTGALLGIIIGKWFIGRFPAEMEKYFSKNE